MLKRKIYIYLAGFCTFTKSYFQNIKSGSTVISEYSRFPWEGRPVKGNMHLFQYF